MRCSRFKWWWRTAKTAAQIADPTFLLLAEAGHADLNQDTKNMELQ